MKEGASSAKHEQVSETQKGHSAPTGKPAGSQDPRYLHLVFPQGTEKKEAVLAFLSTTRRASRTRLPLVEPDGFLLKGSSEPPLFDH